MVARWHQALCVIQWTCWRCIWVQMSQWESVFVSVMGQWKSGLCVMSQVTFQWAARCCWQWNKSVPTSQKPWPSYTWERDTVYNADYVILQWKQDISTYPVIRSHLVLPFVLSSSSLCDWRTKPSDGRSRSSQTSNTSLFKPTLEASISYDRCSLSRNKSIC